MQSGRGDPSVFAAMAANTSNHVTIEIYDLDNGGCIDAAEYSNY